MFYFTKTPWWLRKLYSDCVWQIPTREKIIYLTFDDGPHPVATPFVLDTLKQYNASATFFCIGKNVVSQPGLYNRILNEGHAVGNHTFNHLNGWQTNANDYLQDITEAKTFIHSHLFRPPYGRVTKKQLKLLTSDQQGFKPIMWSVLSGDFDITLSKENCLQQVLKETTNGAIVVFHDSEKALGRMAYALPKILEYFAEKGYRFEKIQI